MSFKLNLIQKSSQIWKMLLTLFWSTASPDHCTICRRTCNSIVLSSQVSEFNQAHWPFGHHASKWVIKWILFSYPLQMKPEVQMYFTDPADLSKKYHSQLSQVIKIFSKSTYYKSAITFYIHTPTASPHPQLRTITCSRTPEILKIFRIKNNWSAWTSVRRIYCSNLELKLKVTRKISWGYLEHWQESPLIFPIFPGRSKETLLAGYGKLDRAYIKITKRSRQFEQPFIL